MTPPNTPPDTHCRNQRKSSCSRGRPPAAGASGPADGLAEGRPAARSASRSWRGAAQVEPVDRVVAAVDGDPRVLEPRLRVVVVVVQDASGGRRSPGSGSASRRKAATGVEARALPGLRGHGRDRRLAEARASPGASNTSRDGQLQPREVVAELGPLQPGAPSSRTRAGGRPAGSGCSCATDAPARSPAPGRRRRRRRGSA